MRGIADTGFIVAFANRRDRYFRWAHGLAKEKQVVYRKTQSKIFPP